MSATSIKDLVVPLVRPQLKPDQWSEDYLLSVISAHGVRRLAGKDLERIRGCLPAHASTVSEGEFISNPRAARLALGRPTYGGSQLPGWASLSRVSPIRYCPLCFTEARYLRARWRIPSLQVCTRHGCFLKSDMVEPALSQVAPGSVGLIRSTASDEDLLRDAACCLPEEFAVLSSIWGPMERAAEASSGASADEEVARLVAWSLLCWRVVERVASSHVHSVVKTTSIGSLPAVARLWRDLRLEIAPSQEGLKTFLLSLRDNLHFMAARSVLRRLILDEERHATLLGKLPLAELEALCGHAAPRPTGITRPWEVALRDLRARCFTRNEVMDEFGVSETVVNHWIRRGLLPRVEVRQVGRKRLFFIDREDVRLIRRRLLSLIFVKDFIASSGMDRAGYLALRSVGLLDAEVVASRRYVARTQLTALVCQLELMSSPRPEYVAMEHPLFGQSTRGLCGSCPTYAGFVRAALEGRFTIFRDPQKGGLSAFSFGADGLAVLHSTRVLSRIRAAAASKANPAQLALLEDCA